MIIAKGIWKSELIDIYSVMTNEQSLTKEMNEYKYIFLGIQDYSLLIAEIDVNMDTQKYIFILIHFLAQYH